MSKPDLRKPSTRLKQFMEVKGLWDRLVEQSTIAGHLCRTASQMCMPCELLFGEFVQLTRKEEKDVARTSHVGKGQLTPRKRS